MGPVKHVHIIQHVLNGSAAGAAIGAGNHPVVNDILLAVNLILVQFVDGRLEFVHKVA